MLAREFMQFESLSIFIYVARVNDVLLHKPGTVLYLRKQIMYLFSLTDWESKGKLPEKGTSELNQKDA